MGGCPQKVLTSQLRLGIRERVFERRPPRSTKDECPQVACIRQPDLQKRTFSGLVARTQKRRRVRKLKAPAGKRGAPPPRGARRVVGRQYSPSSNSLSSRRASFLSRRSCRSISALMRCDSFSSADRQQQPAMVRAAPDGSARQGAGARRSSARPSCAGPRGLKRKAGLDVAIRALDRPGSAPQANTLRWQGSLAVDLGSAPKSCEW